ncbi:MAG: hypothetical protein IJW99_11210 [Clostridia bacterium]|nr:hypothetical protein [Clostridia bacterium]
MRFKRIMAWMLCGLMLLSAIACGKSGEQTESTTTAAQNDVTTAPAGGDETDAPEETGPVLDEWGREVIEDDVPEDLNFNGATLNILARSDAKNRWRVDFYAPEINGDVLNDAVYNRNALISDRLNISFSVREEDGRYDVFTSYANIITAAYQSGSHEFDLVGSYSLYGAQYATQGYFYNVLDLHQDHHLNLDQIWWNQSLREDLTIADRLYMLVGDMNTTTLTRMMAIFFNQKTVSEVYKDLDLYQVVNDGKWTMDYLAELINEGWQDLNGNGTADDTDFYGLVTVAPSEAYDSVCAGMEIEMMERDDKGEWIFTGNTELLVDKVQKAVNLYHAGNNATRFYSMDPCVTKFAEDGSHFLLITLDKAMEDILGNMKADYGVLPLPKYNEEQEMYHTIPQDAFNMIHVMGDIQDPAMVSAALELMCAESYKTVTPELFNEVLKYRYMRDDASGQMLDHLRAGLRMDFATINTRSLAGAGQWFRNQVNGSKASAANGAASSLKAQTRVWENALKKLVDSYEKLS